MREVPFRVSKMTQCLKNLNKAKLAKSLNDNIFETTNSIDTIESIEFVVSKILSFKDLASLALFRFFKHCVICVCQMSINTLTYLLTYLLTKFEKQLPVSRKTLCMVQHY